MMHHSSCKPHWAFVMSKGLDPQCMTCLWRGALLQLLYSEGETEFAWFFWSALSLVVCLGDLL